MALVSYTQSALGQPMQFTMNKNELLSIPKVMADSIFKFESNWFRVSFVFKHTTSGKRFVPSFRTFSATKYLKLRSGMVDSDQFELKKIIISKSNRSHLVIKTNEIPNVASYMFSLSGSGEESSGGGGGGVQNFTLDSSLKDSSITLSNNGLTATRTSQGSYSYVSSLLNRPVLLSGSDKLYFEITVNNTAGSSIDAFGFVFNTTTPTTFGSNNLTLPGFPSNEVSRVIIQGSSIYKQFPSTGIQYLQGGFDFQNNAVLGVAVDVAAKTFFFVKNGTASNTFSFADVPVSSTKLYFAVGPFAINDQYSINSTPVHLPVGYTSALIDSSSNSNGGGGGGGQVDPPAPVMSTNSLGSFFDGRLPVNESPFSKSNDTVFFSSANRFVSVGGYYGNVSFGGIPLKSATIDLASGELDAASADLFQDNRIKAIHHKSDLSKSWIIGQFKTEYNGTQLPALPVYNGTTVQSTNCFRVLEINRSTGAVTHKLDIQTSYDAVGFGGSHNQMIDMKVDEANGDVFLYNGSYLVKYNFNTGPVWGKSTQIGYGSYEKYTHKLTLTTDSVFVNVRNYDNVELTGYSWNNGGYIKVSRADGSRDTSFTIPVDGNYYPEVMRSISSDGSKVAYLIYDTSVSNLVAHTYSNGSWTKHSAVQFVNGGIYGIIAESDYFYVLGTGSSYDKYIQKIDYSGNVVSTAFLNLGSNYNNNPSQYSFFKNGDKFYYRRYDHVLVKRDIATGAEETLDIPIAFDGNTQFTLSFVNNKVVVEVHNHQYYSFTFKDETYLQIPSIQNTIAVGVYNASTGALVKATEHTTTDSFNEWNTRILKSNTITNKCWFVGYYGSIHEIDLATGTVTKLTNISFEAVPSHVLSSTFVDGNYLYAIAGTTEIKATDSTGTYTKNYMTRINLSTKLVDQSFSVSNPSWGESTRRKVDVTDNFIYVTSLLGGYGDYTKNMVRFRKSNFTVQTIDYTATFPVPSIQYRQEFIGISKLDSTRIVVYGNKQYGANSGWAKPYLIFDEESMTPVASQPSFTGQPIISSYSAEFGKLVTINTAANYWEQEISVYDVATETKTVFVNSSQYQPSGQSPMFNGGYPSSILFFNDHIFIEMGYSSNSYKNEQYSGIIKINSSGEVVND